MPIYERCDKTVDDLAGKLLKKFVTHHPIVKAGVTDSLQLDRLTRRALRFFKTTDGARRVFEVVLDYSFALGKPAAKFSSHRVLHLETGLSKNRLSEALTDLVACRLCLRDGHGKGGLILTPLPDWWHWALQPVAAQFADREFLASIIGGLAVATGDHWTVTTYRARHPAVVYATAYARGQFDHRELFPHETNLREEVAAVAREEALATVNLKPNPNSETQVSALSPQPSILSFADRVAAERDFQDAKCQPDELVLMAARLWPSWPAYRRDPFIRMYARKSRRRLYVALCRASESTKPIEFPHGWIKQMVTRILPAEEATKKTEHCQPITGN